MHSVKNFKEGKKLFKMHWKITTHCGATWQTKKDLYITYAIELFFKETDYCVMDIKLIEDISPQFKPVHDRIKKRR